MCVTDWWAKVTLEGISEAEVGMVISDISPLAPGKEKLQAEATTGSFQSWRRCKKQDSAAVVTEGGKGEHPVCSCAEAAAFQTQWGLQSSETNGSLVRTALGTVGGGRRTGESTPQTSALRWKHWRLWCGGVLKRLLRPWTPDESVGEEEAHGGRVWEHVLVCKGSLGSPRNKTGPRGSGGRSQWSAVAIVNVMLFIFLFQFLFF